MNSTPFNQSLLNDSELSSIVVTKYLEEIERRRNTSEKSSPFNVIIFISFIDHISKLVIHIYINYENCD